MTLEVLGALAVAGLVFWLVFQPLVAPAAPELALQEPEAPEETRRGVALLALKEIEFDRATGKLSDEDYEFLKGRYSTEAIAALEADEAGPDKVVAADDPETLIAVRLDQLRSASVSGSSPPPPCPSCGPRPEPDALFCSRCGHSLHAVVFCASCGAALTPDGRFCAGCGGRVAA